VDLLAFLRVAQQLVSAGKTVKTALAGGQLEELLLTMGDVHFKAARIAIADARRSNRPEREFESAVTSMREAMVSFSGGWTLSSRKREYEAACLLAFCYKVLAADNLRDQYLRLADETFEAFEADVLQQAAQNRGKGFPGYREARIFGIIFDLISPMDEVRNQVNQEREEHKRLRRLIAGA
jgi:hypothetical protein